jgi:hypothetical protein
LATYQTRGGSNAANGNTATRAAAHEPASLTFSLQLFDYTEATVGTLRDWVYRTATFAAAIGFEDADAEVFSFQVTLTFNRPNAENDQTLTYTRCIVTSFDESEGEPNTATITMQVLGTEVAATVP